MKSRSNKQRALTTVSCLALLALSGGAQAVPVSAWEINSVSGFRNGSWSFGDIFTVGSSNITVTSLGALDVGLDGFVSTSGIPVGLFRESDGLLLASGTVLGSDALIGNYRFADITDVMLNANTQYRVVAVNINDLYNITTGTPNVVDSRITWNGYGYCSSSALTSCNQFTGTERTWFANFQLDDGNTVPEPETLALLGIGLAGLGLLRRRRAA